MSRIILKNTPNRYTVYQSFNNTKFSQQLTVHRGERSTQTPGHHVSYLWELRTAGSSVDTLGATSERRPPERRLASISNNVIGL